ncbi:MAG TPA: GNAT family N-acetyltransferase [Tepidisphaeraceae bacterium]|jgi:ribosomal protein S18 acetylase RimI-like enzyme
MPDDGIVIRSFTPADEAACQALYHEGAAGGLIAPNDTGLDIDDIQMAYMTPPGNHFWVAVGAKRDVVGMIGVMHSDGVGEIRRLRVAEAHQRRGIGSRLLEKALTFCREQNYLKVALDTVVDREPAMKLFGKYHFRHGKSRRYSGKELMYFYLDLYSGETKDANG